MKRWLSGISKVPEVASCRRETAQWFPLLWAYLGVRPLTYPYLLRLRSGEQITLKERTDLIVFWLVFVRKHYPVARSDRIIVDVGANIGMFTLFAARQAPEAQIFAVEPFPDTSDRLQSLIVANHLENRVTVLNLAVAGREKPGSMDIAAEVPSQYRRIYSETTKSLNRRHRNLVQSNPEGVSVKVKTLGQLIDEIQTPGIDLLKLNIHGSEYEVLMSTPTSVLQRIGRIAVQYHEMPAEMQLGKRPLFEHLEHAGFRVETDRDSRRGAGLAVLRMAA